MPTPPYGSSGGTNVNVVGGSLDGALPAGTNLIGKVKLSDGTDDINVNPDGSLNAAAPTGTAYSTTQTGISATGNSSDIDVSKFRELVLDVNLTALTGTSVAFKVERKDALGNYVSIYAPAALTGVSTIAQTIGVGAETNKGFGGTVKITWTCTAVTTTTFTVSLIGK